MDENRVTTTEEPVNPHVRAELRDVNAKFLTKFGIGMAFTIVVFLFCLVALFRYFTTREEALGPPPSQGVGVTAQKLPPEPRLQEIPIRDMEQMRAAENEILNQYAWIDPEKGIARIPVSRAMEIMLSRNSFPVRSQPGVPPGATGEPLGIEAAGGAVERMRPDIAKASGLTQ